MPPTVAELLAALPDEDRAVQHDFEPRPFEELFAKLSRQPVPMGSLRRLWTLSGLQARIGMAYLAYWVRGFFQGADAKQQSLMETHLSSAVRTLSTMGYLRGAVMKIGQAAANFPDLVPDEFVETLSHLHFEAPPMHYSLLREYVRNELGDDPENLFEWFDTNAIAAASLGQVHRAKLKSGDDVVLKIQYPGIGRTIRSDFRNLSAVLLPLRFSKDWENLKSQIEEIRRVLETETDYEQEADYLRTGRSLFREDDGILIPRVYDRYSTRRILTMEYIDGRNFYDFLAENPSQEMRNHFGSLMVRGQSRLIYSGRIQYADPHPGNFLFLEDGRLGMIDFGCMRPFNDEEWEYIRVAENAVHGSREDVLTAIFGGTDFSEEEVAGTEMLDLMVEYCRWIWQPMVQDEPFDYGDAETMRRGIEIIRRFTQLARPRQKPVNVFIQRSVLAGWGLQYRLQSQVNVKSICDEEISPTGWRQRNTN